MTGMTIIMNLICLTIMIITTTTTVSSFICTSNNHRYMINTFKHTNNHIHSHNNQVSLSSHPTHQQRIPSFNYRLSNQHRYNKYFTPTPTTTTSSSTTTCRLMSTTATTILDVALDQPLYPPIKKYLSTTRFWNKLFGTSSTGTIGVMKLILYKFNTFLQSILSNQILKCTFIFTIFVLITRYIVSSNIIPSTLGTKYPNMLEPISFDPNINEGWSICKLKSITKYGKTNNFLFIDMILPKQYNIVSLELGQTLHICGLDQHNNAIQAEFYPYQPNNRKHVRSGYISLLVPDPSNYSTISSIQQQHHDHDEYDDSTTTITTTIVDNDLQQIQVIQLLQDYIRTGDTEIAIHPGTCKLIYRGTYPVTNIYYLVIGTGIVPVLDQIRTVLKNKSTTNNHNNLEYVSIVWINQCIEDFDIISQLLKDEYNQYSSMLSVTCGIETNLIPPILYKPAAQYFFNNNIEINDTIPYYQPGMMIVISIDGIPSSSLLRNGAIEYIQEKKNFPNECVCVM